MNCLSKNLRGLGILLLAPVLGAVAQPSLAEELAAGTVINAANIDSLQESTFEGHPISELIPPALGRLVRDYKLEIPIKHSEKNALKITDKFWEATRKYSPQVKFDPQTRQISGYVAGIPFPEISEEDPHAGDKELYNLFWNFGYFGPAADGDFPFIFVNAKGGVERTQLWHQTVMNFSGRAIEPHALPLGEQKGIQKRDALFAIEPFDIKGLGTFTQRYINGEKDDAWVYIRAIRRTRRLSGGSWADAIGGSDVNLDDINGFNAHPTWFQGARLVKKQWMLVWHIDKPQQNHDAKNLNDKFPYLKLEEWPHWNTVQQWQPALVNVIEITPGPGHPFYSKKVLYDLAEYPGTPFLLEAYDKQGNLWKVETIARGSKADEHGDYWFAGFCSFMHDLKFEHATLLVGDEFFTNHRLQPEDVTQNMLVVQ